MMCLEKISRSVCGTLKALIIGWKKGESFKAHLRVSTKNSRCCFPERLSESKQRVFLKSILTTRYPANLSRKACGFGRTTHLRNKLFLISIFSPSLSNLTDTIVLTFFSFFFRGNVLSSQTSYLDCFLLERDQWAVSSVGRNAVAGKRRRRRRRGARTHTHPDRTFRIFSASQSLNRCF